MPLDLGRRERNKREKRDRIARAAASLFAEHGYAATTTQQVAAAADVASGTVFSYAGTKPELLLMVINEQLRPLLRGGRAAAGRAASLEDAVLELLEPVVDLAARQPENAGPFLREVLFGDDGPHRAESLALMDEVVADVAALLAPHAVELPDGMALPEAARWIFSALVVEVLRHVTGRAVGDPRALLRARVRVMLRGLGVR